jgi:hypothetical protein
MKRDRTMTVGVWETESRSWGGLIQPLSSHAMRVLCLDAIGLCLASLRPSAEEVLGASSARLARRALDLLRHHFSHGELAGEFVDSLRALREADDSPAVASVVTAFTEYAGAMSAGLDASDVLVVMSACYEAVRHAEQVPPGHGNQTLTRLITAQRGLIGAAVLA